MPKIHDGCAMKKGIYTDLRAARKLLEIFIDYKESVDYSALYFMRDIFPN